MFFNKKKESGEKGKSVTEVKEKGIYVLGSGCQKCNSLESNVKQALKKLAINEEVMHITDFSVIASLGVMTTPALVIDQQVASYGKVLSVDEALDIIKKYRK